MAEQQYPDKEYIRALRAGCKAAIKRGEQIDFYDALVISRPTGEQASYWLHMALRETQAQRNTLLEAITHVHRRLMDTYTPEDATPLHEELLPLLREALNV